VNHGGTASFTVTPATGFHVVLPLGGTCGQGVLSGNDYVTAQVTANCSVVASFERNPPHHLAFVTPVADVFQGDRLGALQVAIVDVEGNVIPTDSTSQITLSTDACGGTVELAQATVENGVASFPAGATKRFYTLASGKALTAGSGSFGGSTTFNVVSGGGLVFANDFDGCRL
jgi:hypothetical protein